MKMGEACFGDPAIRINCAHCPPNGISRRENPPQRVIQYSRIRLSRIIAAPAVGADRLWFCHMPSEGGTQNRIANIKFEGESKKIMLNYAKLRIVRE